MSGETAFLPLALYVHWPFCKAKCPYCDFNSHVRERVDEEQWQRALLTELDYWAQALPQYRLTSIFFGGGTPSLMPPGTAAVIIERAATHWQINENTEITLEANPTSVEAQRFADFRQAGVNRASLGVQALNAADLRFLGRQHSAGEALAAIETARNHFPRFSFDLIYARPGQSVLAWEKELAQALAYVDGHLSLYQLTIEENTTFHTAYQRGAFTLPEEETAAQMFELTQDIMEAHGLPAYEVSNHARLGEESRHNLAYWQGQEYVGIGPGAHGRITLQGERLATQTIKSPERWLDQVTRQEHGLSESHPLSLCEQMEEYVMMGLRLREGLDKKAFHARFGLPLEQALPAHARTQLSDLQLLKEDGETLRATGKGWLVLNHLTGELLAADYPALSAASA